MTNWIALIFAWIVLPFLIGVLIEVFLGKNDGS